MTTAILSRWWVGYTVSQYLFFSNLSRTQSRNNKLEL